MCNGGEFDETGDPKIGDGVGLLDESRDGTHVGEAGWQIFLFLENGKKEGKKPSFGHSAAGKIHWCWRRSGSFGVCLLACFFLP
jgi:hypothetical protein